MPTNFGKMISGVIVPERIDTFDIIGYTPTPKQKLFHEESAKRVHAILFGGAASGGKEAWIGEAIPTPDGFVPLKDVHAGDMILGRDGKPYRVLSESPIHNHDAYRLTFDDGSSVIVNDEHLWLTYNVREMEALTRLDPEWRAARRTRRPRQAGTGSPKSAKFTESLSKRNSERTYDYKDAPGGTVRTTAEIMATLHVGKSGRNNHSVPVCSPVELPERPLPIPPYTLGAWLGDGYSASGRICGADEEVFTHVVDDGFIIKARQENYPGFHTVNFEGLTDALRAQGLIGAKHIPNDYLWGSRDQRLALLQGLMDTDGNCLTNGTAEFVNTNQNLVEGVAHIARSLGHKVAVREFRTKLNGKDYGPAWRVKFRAKEPVFRLSRKAERLQLEKISRRTMFRHMVSAEYLGKEDMKCLRVDSPDSLFLITENFIPTHNSLALTMDAIDNAVNNPNMRIACFRRTYGELEESFLAQLAKWNFARALGARWNGTARLLTFPNGSTINFTFADNIKDASRILGGEYQAFYIDEAVTMIPQIIQHIEERLRSGTKTLPVIGLRLATNPGSVGHKYLKDRFIKPTEYGKQHYWEKIGDTGLTREIVYIQSLYTDNPYINEGYEAILNAIPDPQRRAAMRDGDWDAMVGQFFEQWSRSRHCVPSFPLPTEWIRYAGIDWGTANPWAVCWLAQDNDGRVWVYREKYATRVPTEDQATLILEAENAAGEASVIRVADPSMWGDRGTPMSLADVYGIAGCGISQANNNRPSGWSRVHAFLNDGPACEYHRAQGWIKCPMLHVFAEECPSFVETVPSVMRSDNNPDDVDTHCEDHMADALRYVLMAVGTYPRPIFYDDKPEETQTRSSLPRTTPMPEAEKPYQGTPLPLYGGGLFVGAAPSGFSPH